MKHESSFVPLHVNFKISSRVHIHPPVRLIADELVDHFHVNDIVDRNTNNKQIC